MVFRDTTSYDPSKPFHQCSDFLGDWPNKPLSFRKTQLELLHTTLEISHRWDVDSIWIGAKTLGALKSPNDTTFHSAFSPLPRLITPLIKWSNHMDGALRRQYWNIHFGTVDVFNFRFAVFFLSPNADK
ncbi:hypothetical protein VB005_09387 [Metarhizium brunneum]